MRDPKRIDDILSLIGEIWRDSPDLRLGQLILNVLGSPKGERPDADQLFFIEDDIVEQSLRAWRNESQPIRGSDDTVH